MLGPAAEVPISENSSSSPEISLAVLGRNVDDAVGVELVRELDIEGLFMALRATTAMCNKGRHIGCSNGKWEYVKSSEQMVNSIQCDLQVKLWKKDWYVVSLTALRLRLDWCDFRRRGTNFLILDV